MNKYTIISGYCEATKENDENRARMFWPIWLRNTCKDTTGKIYIVNVARQPSDTCGLRDRLEFINADNFGHNCKQPQIPLDAEMDGWGLSVLIGALICYHNKTDMIFKEQDCLAFGPWVDELYREAEAKNAQMITGKNNPFCNLLAQSLFFIRNSYLLRFINNFIGISFGKSAVTYYGEHKFKDLIKLCPDDIKMTDMGYDRSRPLGYDDKCFYAQQLKDSELAELRARNLI